MSNIRHKLSPLCVQVVITNDLAYASEVKFLVSKEAQSSINGFAVLYRTSAFSIDACSEKLRESLHFPIRQKTNKKS